MRIRTELVIHGGQESYMLFLEPYTFEFPIAPGDRCKLVALSQNTAVRFDVGWDRRYLVVWAENDGEDYDLEFWRGDNREFSL